MLSPDAQKQILAHLYSEEAYRQFSYDDATGLTIRAPVGNITIGIGWNIQANGCPKEIAEFAAMYFVRKADERLTRRIPFYDALDEPTKVALCDMAYNMGVDNVLEFKNMLEALRRDDRKTAAIAMLNSKWARQTGKRAVPLSKMVETKQWVEISA